MTSQAPHAHRTVFALVAGLPEHQIRIISPDLGGGFGNKVPIYPGYVVATAASLLIGRPVKWIEDRTGNLISTGFARDFHMQGELALKDDGKMTGLRVKMLSDQGRLLGRAADEVQGRALPHRHRLVRHPGRARRHRRRVHEQGAGRRRLPLLVPRHRGLVPHRAARPDGGLRARHRPGRLPQANFIQPDQFPYTSATGFEYDSGDYETAMDLALEKLGYDGAARGAGRAREEGRLLGIGIASFTEVVGAGPSRQYDILGIKMFDSAELRLHPTGKAILKLGVKTQGQGHETTFAQIVADELGLPPDDVEVQEGDTDDTPYGLGTYASRSTPVAGAATAVVARNVRAKAQKIAAHLLEAAEEDVEWRRASSPSRARPTGRRRSRRSPSPRTRTSRRAGGRARGAHYYDPPNMTYPFGTYAVVVEIDRGTGEWKVLKVVAVDDCGVRINPMIVEGQIMGGLTEGYAMAAMELIAFDEDGNCIGSNFMDYLIPTAWETPAFELGATVTPSPHHPIGAKGVGESATVGSPAAFVNAVVDALAHAGVRNLEMPVTSDKVWEALQEAGLAE